MAVIVGCLVISACSAAESPHARGDSTSARPREHNTPLPDFKKACAAGYTEGQKLYDGGGKGAAVREVAGGGCTRRALQAGTAAAGDRGAWVKGCQDGVSDTPEDVPTHTVTKRESNPQLLDAFRAWARKKGDEKTATHAREIFSVELAGPDYDVELTTDFTAMADRAKAEDLTKALLDWWDGDDGQGLARNLIILDSHDRRLLIKAM